MIAAPSLDALINHLSRTPPETLEAGRSERLLLPLLWDCHQRLGILLSADAAADLCDTGPAGPAIAAACRILAKLTGSLASPDPLRTLFRATLPGLAAMSAPDRWIRDPEGSEEFVRLVLRDLGVTPQGETAARAADRLQSISLLERHRLVGLSREAEARAREVREALRAQAAKEAADKYTRE